MRWDRRYPGGWTVIADRAQAVDWIAQLDVVRQEQAQLRNRNEQLTDALKQWLALEGLERLDYEELGIAAVLQARHGTDYDLIALAKASPPALLELALAGCLKVDSTALKGQRGKRAAVDDLQRYAMPQESVALVIERAK